MLRRSAGLLARTARQLPSTNGAGATCEPGVSMVPALALFDRWQAHGAGSVPHAHLATRSFTLFGFGGGSSKDKDTAAAQVLPGDDAPGAAAEAATSTSSAAAAAAGTAAGDASLSFSPDAIIDAAGVAEAAALAAALEDAWLPSRALQYSLRAVHDAGLPWWESIMLTTAGVRLVMLPIMLMQIKNTYKLSQARPEIERLLEHMKEEQAKGNANATGDYQKRVMGVWKKYDCNPMKSMASIFVQAPLFIGFFSALRAFAAHKLPSFTEGGALWFTDLSVADPFYALPVIASATFLLTIELGAADGMEGQPEKTKSRMKNVMRFVAVAIVPFTLSMPAGVFMYWTASNFFSLTQMLVLKNSAVKAALGLPDLKKANLPQHAELVGKPVTTFAQKPKKAAPAVKA